MSMWMILRTPGNSRPQRAPAPVATSAVLALDDADVPVGLDHGELDLLGAGAVGGAHLRLEFGDGDRLPAQHVLEHLAIARDQHRSALDDPVQLRAARGQEAD